MATDMYISLLKKHIRWVDLLLVLVLGLMIASCRAQSAERVENGLNVLATTSLVGDVVSQVGGEKVSVKVLLPLGTDPHSFSPTPRDASEIADADLIFANGAGLEEFLTPLLESVGNSAGVYEVSMGIDFRRMVGEESGTQQIADDPHTWTDPNNVIVWVDNIVQSLSEQDPINADYYRQNGNTYQEQLKALDGWIKSQVSSIPPGNRELVTEHLVFGYFADRYGFDQLGAIIPGFSSLAEPSAQDISQIEEEINKLGVRAIFLNVGNNASLAERISTDTGTRLVYLYMHSLSQPGGDAGTYLDMMRYDVISIVEALK